MFFKRKEKPVEQKCEYKNVWDKEIRDNVLKKYPGKYGNWIDEDENKLEWHAYWGYYDFLMEKHPDDTEEIDKVKFLIMLTYVGTKFPTFEEAYSQLRDWLIFH